MLPTKAMPSQEILREYFDYIPTTGCLSWRDKPEVSKRVRGKLAGTQLGTGYRSVWFKGKLYLAHRLIWTWMTGDDPGEAIIDHKNHNRADNAWENLELSDWSKNMENMRDGRPNLRKLKEPNISMQDGRYRVQIKRGGIRYRSATFKTLQEAVAWRDEVIAKHFRKA